ncbi:hypothetical protein ABZT47_15695 [Sphaerisporangium sp. NPDC005289]|uniref:hypothetical protein n=1 Tax=Sphaerisporangium sp. NPDC005289 TaxID=3155247 RepID=UPI0033AC8B48
MHNATGETLATIRPSVMSLQCDPIYARMYGKDHREQFKRALRTALSPEKATHYTQELLEAPVLPAGGLMAVVSDSVCHRLVFPLLDEQREAYDYVRGAVTRSKQGAPKEAIVIVGGPGTGRA